MGPRRAIFGLFPAWPVNRSTPKTSGILPKSGRIGRGERADHFETGGGGATGYKRSTGWSLGEHRASACRKGNREGEGLWPPLCHTCNAFLAAEPSEVYGACHRRKGACAWHPRGGGGCLDHLHSPGGYDETEILRCSNRQFGPIVADTGHCSPNMPDLGETDKQRI